MTHKEIQAQLRILAQQPAIDATDRIELDHIADKYDPPRSEPGLVTYKGIHDIEHHPAMGERIFLKRAYIGSDGDRFVDDFIAYLRNAADNIGHAMSDRAIFLQGGEQAIREIIDELEQEASDE